MNFTSRSVIFPFSAFRCHAPLRIKVFGGTTDAFIVAVEFIDDDDDGDVMLLPVVFEGAVDEVMLLIFPA